MALINVNPTRMELTNLKRRLVMARRGHRLLKDKRDELMRRFLELVRENKSLRRQVEKSIRGANAHMAISRSLMQREVLDVALLSPRQHMEIDIEQDNVMSVMIPKFNTKFSSSNENDFYFYGYAFTSGDLDTAVKGFHDILPEMLRLAEVEKSCQLMAAEIEKTRRRVNALEHVMIPQYEETIRFITMKLDESERSATTRLMKIKDKMLAEAHNYTV
ncbi:MAG: V-type ATP synthase subunit D [Oscillospiraceae bacterium]|nr:V-type ATP synthase subunit D [Oscillospiraceae bacterium]MDD4414581.1 V-type ATP synthase subunit D [Oscillospiraceae bacterium]